MRTTGARPRVRRGTALLFAALGAAACNEPEQAPQAADAARAVTTGEAPYGPPRVYRLAVLNVAVRRETSGGQTWDVDDRKGSSRPDIAVCVRAEGHRACYPGGDKLTGPACHDSFDCEVRVHVPTTGEFDVEVWDIDLAMNDLISRGRCSFGATCKLTACTVRIGESKPVTVRVAH